MHLHRKLFLPTYGVFDEERFLSRGRKVGAFETRFGKMAMLVCEDAWHAIVPTIAAVKGARVLIVPAASPGRGIDGDGELASITRWRQMLIAAALEHGIFVVYAGLTGFEGGKGLSGTSCAIDPRGNVLVEAPATQACIVRADLDLREIDLARAGLPVTRRPGSRAARITPCSMKIFHCREAPVTFAIVEARAESPRPPGIDCAVTTDWLVAFLRDELLIRRKIPRAVIGLSGGVDSAVTAFLCARALGAHNVHAFRLPYATSSVVQFFPTRNWWSMRSASTAALSTSALRWTDILRFEPDARTRGVAGKRRWQAERAWSCCSTSPRS